MVQILIPHLVSLLAAACIVQRDNVQEGDQGLPECFYQMHQKCTCVLKVFHCVKGHECGRERMVPVGFNAGQCSAGGKELIDLRKQDFAL